MSSSPIPVFPTDVVPIGIIKMSVEIQEWARSCFCPFSIPINVYANIIIDSSECDLDNFVLEPHASNPSKTYFKLKKMIISCDNISVMERF